MMAAIAAQDGFGNVKIGRLKNVLDSTVLKLIKGIPVMRPMTTALA
jgi:hypothetical protein